MLTAEAYPRRLPSNLYWSLTASYAVAVQVSKERGKRVKLAPLRERGMGTVGPWEVSIAKDQRTPAQRKHAHELELAWDDGWNDCNEWLTSNPSPRGVWSDPPRNPYREG
jgi:hypothetical protein